LVPAAVLHILSGWYRFSKRFSNPNARFSLNRAVGHALSFLVLGHSFGTRIAPYFLKESANEYLVAASLRNENQGGFYFWYYIVFVTLSAYHMLSGWRKSSGWPSKWLLRFLTVVFFIVAYLIVSKLKDTKVSEEWIILHAKIQTLINGN
jgi:hypothetical protein